ncbi:hypothetical protein [Myroides sp. TSA_177.3]|uniref:hypothetical protein n=1 Tax=Myroides sp. TSA_177.3 TaxID=3415650 RepID=UPI0040451F4B
MKLVTIILLSLMFCSFGKQQNKKEVYISSNLPKIEKLDKEDYEKFMETMSFNEYGALKYWDDALLEKAYPQGTEEYNEIIKKIVSELGYKTDNIILVSATGDEYVIDNTEIKDIKGNQYTLSEIEHANGFFTITSLACGHCLVSFKSLNELTNYDKKIAFVDKLEELEKYKTGYRNQKFGFLNDDWIIFDYNDPLLNEFLEKNNIKYKKGYFPYYFVRENNKTTKEAFKLEDL